MKIRCSQADLSRSLNIVSKAVPVRTSMTILECILIDATANVIKLVANDMELGIETIIPGRIEERGMVALDAKIFIDMIRNMSGLDVTIYSDDKYQTQISCESANFNIPGRSGDNFPLVSVPGRDKSVIISQLTLREVIHQTIFSIGDSDANRLMSGELINVQGNVFKIASLDGHRISVRNVSLSRNYDQIKVIVPGKSLSEIAKILNGSLEDDVNIFVSENTIIFEFDSTTVISRLISGEYFDIDRMMSNDYKTKISINRREMLESISRATLMVNESDRKPIILDIQDEKMEMYIKSQRGSFHETLNINKGGEDILIGFNPKFFLEALRVIDDEFIDIYLVDPKAPCFIRDERNSYIYLILPINFKN